MKRYSGKWSHRSARSGLKKNGPRWDGLFHKVTTIGMLAVVLVQAFLLYRQNERIDKQIYISQGQPAWQELPQIESLARELHGDADKTCLDRAKLMKDARTLGDLDFAPCWGDLVRFHASTKERYRWLEKWNRQSNNITEADFDRKGVIASRYEEAPDSSFDVQGFEFVRDAYLRPSPGAEGAAEVITEALLPYRSVDTAGNSDTDTPELSARPVSRERALVMEQFLDNGYDPVGNFESAFLDKFNFINVQLDGIRLKNASLRCSRFEGSDLRFAAFDGADLTGSVFSSSDLRISSWNGAILDGASFNRVLMPSAPGFRPASLRHVNLSGAIVDAPDWLSELAHQKPKIAGFEEKDWIATQDTIHHGFVIGRRNPVVDADATSICDSKAG